LAALVIVIIVALLSVAFLITSVRIQDPIWLASIGTATLPVRTTMRWVCALATFLQTGHVSGSGFVYQIVFSAIETQAISLLLATSSLISISARRVGASVVQAICILVASFGSPTFVASELGASSDRITTPCIVVGIASNTAFTVAIRQMMFSLQHEIRHALEIMMGAHILRDATFVLDLRVTTWVTATCCVVVTALTKTFCTFEPKLCASLQVVATDRLVIWIVEIALLSFACDSLSIWNSFVRASWANETHANISLDDEVWKFIFHEELFDASSKKVLGDDAFAAPTT